MPLTCVGDATQALYGFTGAVPEIFSNIEKLIPVKEIQLQMNYRSTANLVKLASYYRTIFDSDIPNLKPMIPFKPETEGSLAYKEFDNSYQEYDFITDNIRKLMDSGAELSEIAILSRTNKELLEIEASMIKGHIPYVVKYDSRSLLNKSPFKLIYAILSVVFNPRDVLSLVEIMGHCKGVGEKTAEHFTEVLNAEMLKDPEAVLDNVYYNVQPKAGSYLPLEAIKKDKKILLIESIYEHIINPVRKYLYGNKSAKAILMNSDTGIVTNARLSQMMSTIYNNLKTHFGFDGGTFIKDAKGFFAMDDKDLFKVYNTLLSICESIEQDKRFSGLSSAEKIKEFYASLQMSQDNENDKGRVKILTIHSAKGLEFDYVFFANLRPTSAPMDEVFQLKCMFYVAVTRAKNKLFLTSSYRMPNYKNVLVSTIPNSFLEHYLKGALLLKKGEL